MPLHSKKLTPALKEEHIFQLLLSSSNSIEKYIAIRKDAFRTDFVHIRLFMDNCHHKGINPKEQMKQWVFGVPMQSVP